MPFIGRDWRSPGEAWVKTESLGWQRMKIIESQLYPGCHQSHPACSWPPRSGFGQHMANNCCDVDDNETSSNVADRPGGSGCDGGLFSQGSSGSFSNRSSVNNSPDSSRPGSASTSPTSSPEKNNAHHLHPITISSPYGRHSCCAHHHIESPCGSPRANSSNSFYNYHESKGGASLLKATDNQQPQLTQRCNEDTQTSRQCLSRHGNNMIKARQTGDNCLGLAAKQSEFDSTIIDYTDHSTASQRRSATDSSGSQSSCPGSPILMRNGSLIGETTSDQITEPIKQEQQRDKMGGPLQGQQQDVRFSRSSDCHSNCSVCCCRCSSATTATSNNNLQCLHATKNKEPQPRVAPHCRISVRTREVAMYNTISEAFYRLDFCNAIHDIRRFNYICKLLHLLITQNLTSLSGCATKVLFTMLEQVAWEVSSNKRNIHVLRNLLDELKSMIQKYYCWGRPIGSSLLWQQHFDTIERISQIVDGIELSPPKQEASKVTFDKLPVEMVREILLRLNDYRDLVSSAEASPVMRTMIDSQTVWRQLCRYHFTDQQLKLALASYNFNLAKKSSSLRGVKYARTASADGRTSYRNPVSHKQQQQSSTLATSTTASTRSSSTRQQIEQTSDRRNPANRTNAPTSSPSSSYVTKAIRIFDREGSHGTGVTSRSDPLQCQPSQQEPILDAQVTQPAPPSNESLQQIDWERIFHQLRKRFDLKEEYADCLLLCRHCRCLFWKSFGHPCILNEEEEDLNKDCLDGASGVTRQRNHSELQDRIVRSSNLPGGNLGPSNRRSSDDQRPSVASLSRNFGSSQVQRAARPSEQENLPMEGGRNVDNNINNINNVGRPLGPLHRQPFDDLGAQLRDRNSNNNRNRNSDNRRQQRPGLENNNHGAVSNKPNSRNELVPKHVTITPQAFLKFFSL